MNVHNFKLNFKKRKSFEQMKHNINKDCFKLFNFPHKFFLLGLLED